MLHHPIQTHHRSRARLMALAVTACFAGAAHALPTIPTVVNGNATFSQTGNTLTVTNSNGAIINWGTFSIGAGETTHFQQTSSSSSVLNQVTGTTINGVRTVDPSVILGNLTSNGRVWLINPAGILVGAGARIDTAGFVGSTLTVRPEDFLANRKIFQNTPGAGAVVNQGTIATPSGGSVYLIGSAVSNEGLITTPQGETILAAGETVSLIDTGTPGVRVEVTGAQGDVTNLGEIAATAGRIGMAGVLVKNTGNLNASSAVSEGGRIFLKATGDTYVAGNAHIDASGTKGGRVEVLGHRVAVMDNASIDASGASAGGTVLVGGDYQGKNPDIQNSTVTYFGRNASLAADATGKGNGGKVIVWADGTTRAYGHISAKGGSQGGNGGFVEVSGKQNLAFDALVTTAAPKGKSGTLLLDPDAIIIADGAGGAEDGLISAPNSSILDTDGGTATYTISEAAIESATGTLLLQANKTITINDLTDGVLDLNAGLTNLTLQTTLSGAGEGISFIDSTNEIRSTNGADIYLFSAAGGGNLSNIGKITSTGATGGLIYLAANGGGIDLKNTISSTGTTYGNVKLLAGAGGITNNAGAGVIIGNQLEVISAGAVDIAGNNQINTVAAQVTGAGNQFSFLNSAAGGLTIGTAYGTSGITTNGGQIVVAHNGIGNVTVAENVNAGTGANANITIMQPSGPTGGDVIVNAGKSIQGNSINLHSSGTAKKVDISGSLTAANTILLTGVGSVDIQASASVNAGTTLTIQSDNAINIDPASSLSASTAWLRPFTNGRATQIGGGAGSYLLVSAPPYDNINASILKIGADLSDLTIAASMTGGGANVGTLQLIGKNVQVNGALGTGGAEFGTHLQVLAADDLTIDNDIHLADHKNLTLSADTDGDHVGALTTHRVLTVGTSGSNTGDMTVTGESVTIDASSNTAAFHVMGSGTLSAIAYNAFSVQSSGIASAYITSGGASQWIQSQTGNIMVTAAAGGPAYIQYLGSGLQTVQGAHLGLYANNNLTGLNNASNAWASIESQGSQTIAVTGGLTLQAGVGDVTYNGHNNHARISANGVQQITANSLNIQGGLGGGTASYDNNAAISQQSTAGSQTINIIGTNGMLQLVGGSGSGLSGSGFTQCPACSGWITNNGANIWNKGSGGQTVNFSGTGTKTLNLLGGTLGNGNEAHIGNDSTGAQQILGGAAITLNDGNTGGVIIVAPTEDYHLDNSAGISSEGTQAINAASIAMTGDSTGYGGAYLGGKGGTTINVTGTLAMTAAGTVHAGTTDANGATLTEFNYNSAVAIGEMGNAAVSLNVGNLTIDSTAANTVYGGSPVMIGSMEGTANLTINSAGAGGINVTNSSASALYGSNVMIGSRLGLGGTVTLNAGSSNIALGAAYVGTGATGTVNLQTTAGAISSTANGKIMGGTVNIDAGTGSVNLPANSGVFATYLNLLGNTLSLLGNNSVAHLTASANGNIVYNSASSVHLDSLDSTGGNITVTTNVGSGASVYLGTITGSSSSAVSITADKAIYEDNGPGVVDITAQVINLVSRTGGVAGNLAISADTMTFTDGIVAAQVSGGANGGIRIHNGGDPMTVTLQDAAANGGNIAYTQNGDLYLGGTTALNISTLSGDVAVHANGDLSIDAGGIVTLSTPSSALISASGNVTANVGFTAAAGTSLALVAGNNLTLNSGVQWKTSGGGKLLLAGNNVTMTGAGAWADGGNLLVLALGSGGLPAAPETVYGSGVTSVPAGGVLNLTGSYLKGTNVGAIAGNIVFDGSHIEAAQFAGLASLQDIRLNNGSYVYGGDDVFMALLGATSTLYLNETAAMSPASYVLAGSPNTIHLDFLGRASGGVVIAGVDTLDSTPGGSGLFVVDTSTPATVGAGLDVFYGAADTAATAPLIDALTSSVSDTSSNLGDTTNTGDLALLGGTGTTGGLPTGGTTTGTTGGGEGEFGGTGSTGGTTNGSTNGSGTNGDEKDKDKQASGDDTSGGKKQDDKAQGKKPVGQCSS